ncbi:SNF2 family helicase [Spironucleus salmonicida]|uniref:SNF2 family and helicase domain-containing protein n=1 Tax=Spironucleus salmonicida TaxID=348837 RepID=V6LXF2_9EUKA|nr:SNF2 family helicase [Spironucleus salmonicida]|eukprot:EST49225.1 SNF2 family and helicase domain-containing protein [Spironucleus salmonicida]
MKQIPNTIPIIKTSTTITLPNTPLKSCSEFCATCERSGNTYRCKLCWASTHQKCGNNQQYLLCKSCFMTSCQYCLCPGNNKQCECCQKFYCIDCKGGRNTCKCCQQLGGSIKSIVSVYIKEQGSDEDRLLFLVKIEDRSFWHVKLVSQKLLKILKPRLITEHKMQKVSLICETLIADFGAETFIPMIKIDYQYDNSDEEDIQLDGEESNGSNLTNFASNQTFQQNTQDAGLIKSNQTHFQSIDQYLCGDQTIELVGCEEQLLSYGRLLVSAGVEPCHLVPEKILDQIDNKIFKIKWLNIQFKQSTSESLVYLLPFGRTALIKFFLNKDNLLRKNFYISCQKSSCFQDVTIDNIVYQQLTSIPEYITLDNKNLYDFQLTGINWLLQAHQRNQGVIFADQMGLGKTVQLSCYIATLYHLKTTNPHIIIVPATTLLNWQRELQKWVPFLNVGLIEITDKDSFQYYLDNVQDIILMSYDTIMHLHKRKFIKKLTKVYNKFETLICDEGQKIKAGGSTEVYQALLQLHVEQKIILSGTPIQNCFQELLNLLQFVDQEFFRKSMRDKLILLAEQSSDDLNSIDDRIEAISQIQKIIKPYMLLRTSNDVFKTPLQKVEVIIPVPLTAKQQMIYASILYQDRNVLANKKVKVITKTLVNLRHIANHPILLNKNYEYQLSQISNEKIFSLSNKFQVAIHLIKQIILDNRKVVLFSQFTMVLNIFNIVLSRLKINYLRLDGSVNTQQRQILIDRFTNDKDQNLFLISTTAGGLGINLQAASDLIFYDASWNPQIDVQAQYRAIRIGQTKLVRIYKLCSQDTIDEAIIQRASQKLQFSYIMVNTNKQETGPDEHTEMQELLKFGSEKILKLFNKDQLLDQAQQIKTSGLILDNGEIMSNAQLKEYEKLIFKQPNAVNQDNVLKLQSGRIDQQQFFQAFNVVKVDTVQPVEQKEKQIIIIKKEMEQPVAENNSNWQNIFTDIFGQNEIQMDEEVKKGPKFNLNAISDSESDKYVYNQEISSDREPIQKPQRPPAQLNLIKKQKPTYIPTQNIQLLQKVGNEPNLKPDVKPEQSFYINLDINRILENPGDYLNVIQQSYNQYQELAPKNEQMQEYVDEAKQYIKNNEMVKILFELALQDSNLSFLFLQTLKCPELEKTFYEELRKQRKIQQTLMAEFLTLLLETNKATLKKLNIEIDETEGFVYKNVIQPSQHYAMPNFANLNPSIATKCSQHDFVSSLTKTHENIEFFEFDTTDFFTFAIPSNSLENQEILKAQIGKQIEKINEIKAQASIVKALEFILLTVEFRKISIQVMKVSYFIKPQQASQITQIDLSHYQHDPRQVQAQQAIVVVVSTLVQKMPHFTSRLISFFNTNSIQVHPFGSKKYMESITKFSTTLLDSRELVAALYVLSIKIGSFVQKISYVQLFKVPAWGTEFAPVIPQKYVKIDPLRSSQNISNFNISFIQKIQSTIQKYGSLSQNLALYQKCDNNIYNLLSIASQFSARHHFGIVQNPTDTANRLTTLYRAKTFCNQAHTQLPSNLRFLIMSMIPSEWAMISVACVAHHIAENGITMIGIEKCQIFSVVRAIRSKVTNQSELKLKHLSLAKDFLVFFNSKMDVIELVECLLVVVGVTLAIICDQLMLSYELVYTECWLSKKLTETGLLPNIK